MTDHFEIRNNYFTNNIITLLIGLLFLLTNFQTASVLSFYSSINIKLYSFLFLFLLPFFALLLWKNQASRFPFKYLIFFLWIIIISLLDYIFYGFNYLLFNYLFIIYLFFFILFIYDYGVESILPKMVWIIWFIIVGKGLIFFKYIMLFYSTHPGVHPDIPMFYGGGANLEATWLALIGVFLFRSSYFLIYFIGSLAISVVYFSRAGIIADVFLLFFYIYRNNQIFSKNSIKRISIFIIILIVTGYIVYYFYPYSIERFYLSHELQGGAWLNGRERIWHYLPQLISEHPLLLFLGDGAGNAVKLIGNYVYIAEDNLHNYYFQTLIDFGVIGFILWLVLIAQACKDALFQARKNPYSVFILGYAVISLIQFRGADPILWFVMALYEGEKMRNKLKRNVYVVK